MRRIAHDPPAYAQVLYFGVDKHSLLPSDVLFVDNRARLRQYERLILPVVGDLALQDDPSRLNLSAVPKPLRAVIEREAEHPTGRFTDTAKVAEWLGIVNHRAGWLRHGSPVPPLRLVIAHAESHIDLLLDRIVSRGDRPAAIIFSGSPKMLMETFRTDATVRKTLLLIHHALLAHIPILGICFGMHLLVHAKFDAMVEWLTVPEGMSYEVHRALHAFTKVTPGARRWMVGSRRIRKLPGTLKHIRETARLRRMPVGVDVLSQALGRPLLLPEEVLNDATRAYALKLHGTGFPLQPLYGVALAHPRIASSTILAHSYRLFRPGHPEFGGQQTSVGEVRQHVAEVVAASPESIGTQLHPELYADLLLAITYIPVFADLLRGQGYDLNILRAELSAHDDKYLGAGSRIGYNYVSRILARTYLAWAHVNELVSLQETLRMLARLNPTNPLVPVR